MIIRINDTEMRANLEEKGYDVTDDDGKYNELTMVDIAVNVEKYKWNDMTELWY